MFYFYPVDEESNDILRKYKNVDCIPWDEWNCSVCDRVLPIQPCGDNCSKWHRPSPRKKYFFQKNMVS